MRPYLLLLFIFFLSPFAGAQSPNEKAERLLRREIEARRIPGLQLAVVRNGKIVLLKSFGTAEVQNSVPVTDKSVFPINSCTKAFTGVAIMQLVEEGKIELSAPVSRYLEGLPAAWQPVTIRQLLTHVSGLPNILRVLDPVTNGFGGLNEESAWAKTKAMPMAFPTGERFSYNQTNYALLGKIIDKLGGKPFAQIFKEKQFDAAGMTSTGFGDSRDVVANMAQTYRYVKSLDGQTFGEAKLTNNYAEFPPFRRTASGINSTARDVARWIIALQQRGRLLKTKTALETLWTAGTFNDGSPTQWALGWMTKPRPAHSAVIATGGSRAVFFVYPDDNLAIVVLTNLIGAYPEEFIDELAGVYNPEISASDPVTALKMRLRGRGYEQAVEVYKELKRKNPGFQPTENDLNDWAYRMLNGGGKPKEALEIFKLNVFLYPNSANVYDSLAEAYEKNGERELAVKNYRRALELDPKNTNAAQQLKKLDPDYK